MPIRAIFVRSRFNYDPDQVSLETGFDSGTESRTQQHFKDESDINKLIERFGIGGELPQGVRMPTYEDFGEVYDFHTAANAIAASNEAFMQLPAEIRFNRFRNDPASFVAFCSDDKNRAEAERLGLVPAARPLNTAPAVDAGTAQSSTTNSTSTGGASSTQPTT